jgi:hypothetical protein
MNSERFCNKEHGLMKVKVDVIEGTCGFKTTTLITSDDGTYVAFDIKSECEKIGILSAMLMARSPVNARNELNPMTESGVLQLIRGVLTGPCEACALPVALMKGMQVAAGIAQPRDVQIHIATEGD